MKPRRRPGASAACLLLVSLAARPLPGQEPPAPRTPLDPAEVFEVEELAPGVWAALVIPEPSTYAFANSLVVEGEDGVLVVDTQQSPSAARALVELIRRRTAAPVRWVVNTHWHGDHVQGNEAYREAFPGVHFLAHEATRSEMSGPWLRALERERQGLPATITAREEWLASGRGPDGAELDEAGRAAVTRSLNLRRAYLEELLALSPVRPDVTFSDRLTVHVGGRAVELRHLGPAHTAGDVVVWLPDEGILAVGDLLEEGPLWLDGADVPGWSRALAALEELETAILLPGHGGVRRDGGLLALQSGFLATAVGSARAALEGGVGEEEAVRGSGAELEAWREGFAGLGVQGAAFDALAQAAVREAYRDLAAGRAAPGR